MSEDPFARIERAITAACFNHDAEERLAKDPHAFLAEHGLTDEEIALLAPNAERLALYRTLVRNNLGHVVFQVLPRTRALFTRVGAPPPPHAFDAELRAFLHECGPREHTLRAVPAELVAWAVPRWAALGHQVPSWASELARHELLVFETSSAPAREHEAPVEISIDRGILFADAPRVARYAHAVHEVTEVLGPPALRPTLLLVFRDADHDVQEIELTPFGATLVEALIAGATLGDAVREASRGAANRTPDALLEEASRLLGDLATSGAVLGGHA